MFWKGRLRKMFTPISREEEIRRAFGVKTGENRIDAARYATEEIWRKRGA